MSSSLKCINSNAAGIDIGSRSHFVAVGQDKDSKPVREFGFFTEDLYKLADWLKASGITTIAMEATGSYWIPLYEILEIYKFEVYLVNGRHVKNVSGRKSDVQDCQWLQQLHSYGLLNNSFIPNEHARSLRHLVRHRDGLIRSNARQLQLMQKCLVEMNMQLHNVISDISGDTGLKIIRAIVSGQRDAKTLAQYRDPRCKNSIEIIEKSLTGHYKKESLFSLKQALATYEHYLQQIEACDVEISAKMDEFDNKHDPDKEIKKKREAKKNRFNFDAQNMLYRILGVNLMEIPGMNVKSALTFVSEVGVNVSKFRSAKHFTSWLGLAPKHKISGGKILGKKTVSTSNKLKEILRIVAMTVEKTHSALGGFCRKIKSKHGAPKAYTATARKIAVIIYNMISKQEGYNQEHAALCEKQYNKQYENKIRKHAKYLGFELVPIGQIV